MDHVLTVGELYDKAIDLCLRNAGKIALTLGVFFLILNALSVLNTTYVGGIYTAMHAPTREAILRGTWITVLIYVAHFTLLPMLNGAVFYLFDRMLLGQSNDLRDSLRSPSQHWANIIVASFLNSLIAYLALFTLLVPYAAYQYMRLPAAVVVVVIILAGILTWPISLLMLGSAIGLARVALDAGRVLPAIRNGIAVTFSKMNRRRATGVAIPLLAILMIGTVGFSLAGVEAFVLTGLDAAIVVVRSIGNIIAWSIWVAVATVCYRKLIPVERPQFK